MDETSTGVILSGACGRMGRLITADFLASGKIRLDGIIDSANVGQDIGAVIGAPEAGLNIVPTLSDALEGKSPDVFFDFSTLEGALHNIPEALMGGLDCLVGVTGFTDNDIEKLKTYAQQSGRVLWIVPNFSLGVNLMMKFAKSAVEMFPDCEIVEMHHEGKVDAPSGTAFKTARDLGKGSSNAANDPNPSRGVNIDGVNVHSIRLPGFLAHQEVIFGGRGEVLTIRHDAMSRECFLPGIYLALERISDMSGFVYGLESVID